MFHSNTQVQISTEPVIDLPKRVSRGPMSEPGCNDFGPSGPCSVPVVFHPTDLADAEQHTINHQPPCPACLAANEALQARVEGVAEMTFSEAALWWMRLRQQSTTLKLATHNMTRWQLGALEKFFWAIRLCDIIPGHLRCYQIARRQNRVRVDGKEIHPWKRAADNSCINHELNALSLMLRHCDLWKQLRDYYFPLPIKGWSPREILSEPNEEKLFKTAAKHPEAALAYWVATITNNTTVSGCELRGLRLKNLFLRYRIDVNGEEEISTFYVPEDAVKNDCRPRMIPLNPVAKWAVEQCYKRALRLGCADPDDYLFPFRVNRKTWEPQRPASKSWLRKSWAKLQKATGFYELKPHDLRHLCITRLLERGVEPETVTAIAGHRPNSKMLEYYAHHRTRVKYAAVMAIDKKPASSANSRY